MLHYSKYSSSHTVFLVFPDNLIPQKMKTPKCSMRLPIKIHVFVLHSDFFTNLFICAVIYTVCYIDASSPILPVRSWPQITSLWLFSLSHLINVNLSILIMHCSEHQWLRHDWQQLVGRSNGAHYILFVLYSTTSMPTIHARPKHHLLTVHFYILDSCNLVSFKYCMHFLLISSF